MTTISRLSVFIPLLTMLCCAGAGAGTGSQERDATATSEPEPEPDTKTGPAKQPPDAGKAKDDLVSPMMRKDAGVSKVPDGGDIDDPCYHPASRTVDVATAAALKTAFANAKSGDLIRLAPNTYDGQFELTNNGTEENPIVVCGPRAAVLTATAGYVLHVTSQHTVLSGFHVKGGGKGIVLDGASDNLLSDLEVSDSGDEAVHFRMGSSRNILQGSFIHHTGLVQPGYGEGVYIGSAKSNWSKYGELLGKTPGPDRSDKNKIIGNHIGPGTAAECIDVKEGTTGGEISENIFDGTGITGANFSDSWMDVKGNAYTIADNIGNHAPVDGFQVHVAADGWGQGNVFHGNKLNVGGTGFGINVASKATGNVVGCDNTVTGAPMGLSNVKCVP